LPACSGTGRGRDDHRLSCLGIERANAQEPGALHQEEVQRGGFFGFDARKFRAVIVGYRQLNQTTLAKTEEGGARGRTGASLEDDAAGGEENIELLSTE